MGKTIPVFWIEALRSSAIDKASGVISGVSVVTEGDAKGHGYRIDSTTLLSVKSCADNFEGGVRVKIDHGTGFSNVVGVLKNFRVESIQLKADLHLLKSHDSFETILELAEHMPNAVGLSASLSLSKETIGDQEFARCEDLYSVDFVDRPATNPSGLFSAKDVDSRNEDMADKSAFDELKALLGFSKELSEPKITELSAKLSTSETNLAAATKSIDELSAKNAEHVTKYTELSAKVVDFEAKIAKHATELQAKGTEIANKVLAGLGVSPVSASASQGEAKDFSALVVAQMAAAKCTKGQAIAFCVQNHPAEYLAAKTAGKLGTL